MKNLFYGVMLAVLLAACHKDSGELEAPPAPDILLLSERVFEMPVEKGLVSVEVNSNFDYEVTISTAARSWVHEEEKSTQGTKSIHRFTIDGNDGLLDRTGYIVFGGAQVKDTVSIIQTSPNTVGLRERHIEMPNKEGEFSVQLKGNIDYKVNIPSEYRSWLSEAVNSKAVFSGNHRFKLTKNDNCEERKGMIVFGNDAHKDTLHVTQKGVMIWLSERQFTLIDSTPYHSTEAVFELKTDSKEPLVLEDREFILYEKNIHERVTCIIDGTRWGYNSHPDFPNDTCVYSFRLWSGNSDEDWEDEYYYTFSLGACRDSVLIKGVPTRLKLSEHAFEFSSEGGECSITVKSYACQMTIPEEYASWLSCETKEENDSLSMYTYHFKVAPNPNLPTREGFIIFENDQSKDTVWIFQYNDGPFLWLSRHVFDPRTDNSDITLKTNMKHLSIRSPIGTETVLDFSATSYDYDTYNITVYDNVCGERYFYIYSDNELIDSVCMTMKSIFELSGYEFHIPKEGGSISVTVGKNFDNIIEIKVRSQVSFSSDVEVEIKKTAPNVYTLTFPSVKDIHYYNIDFYSKDREYGWGDEILVVQK